MRPSILSYSAALVLITLCAGTAQALQPVDPRYACQRLGPSYVDDCLSLLSKGYVDPLAAAACDRIKGSRVTLVCLEAVVNQSLSREQILTCDGEETDWETVRCFQRYGNSKREPRWGSGGRGGGGGGGGCNSYGCYPAGGDCNSYGCYSAGGGCNSYGCYSAGGGCNSYGCYSAGGGCNSYGCYPAGGGCNSYGCWQNSRGGCNSYGCSNRGLCNSYGCP